MKSDNGLGLGLGLRIEGILSVSGWFPLRTPLRSISFQIIANNKEENNI